MLEIKIKLIKTPLHLTPLFTQQEGILGYASVYTPQVVRFWQSLSVFGVKTLELKKLRSLLKEFNLVSQVSGQGEYAVRGDIVNFWPAGYSKPIRVEFFGDEVEKAYIYDELYGRQIEDINFVAISSYIPDDSFTKNQLNINPQAINPREVLILSPSLPEMIDENVEVNETDLTFPPLFFGKMELMQHELERMEQSGYKIRVESRSPQALPKFCEKYLDQKIMIAGVTTSPAWWSDRSRLLHDLPAGFLSGSQKQLLLTDREIFGTIHLAQHESDGKTERILRQLEQDINIGDFIVHMDYGVGIYQGLVQEDSNDFLLLEYAKNDKLFVPISQIEKLTKYVSDSIQQPTLTRLGKKEWENIKKDTKKSVGILARELVSHLAMRQMAKASVQIEHEDSKEFNQFEKSFKYDLTADQKRSLGEVLFDLEKSLPMNRLLIGDVGFGKTEVFLRAAYKICEAGGQVAILCPTTILCAQHYALALERFKGTKIRIAELSRFNTSKQNSEIVDKVNAGEFDLIVGTHRMLSRDVKFKKLGLLVVDEEQKFGVAQKERIKKLNYGTHQLSVTATPIPRTLSMALSSIQEISIISTPPKERLNVATDLVKDDWEKLAKAISKEIDRGGQVYFVHNEVQSIASMQVKLEKLLPGVRIVYAHGQMPVAKLDQVVTDFYSHKFDVLLATTIIENGIDMPNVNTMIINKAHKFGLSQLYQLRGRIGRANKQAYCYLFYEGRKKDEEVVDEKGNKVKPGLYLERLNTILNASELGSGFQIASKDLEIRGAGNLLGKEQSGHINGVGYSLYIRMLSQEVERLQNLAEGEKIELFSI